MAEINYINGYEIADAKAREDASEALENTDRINDIDAELQIEKSTRQSTDTNLQSQISSLASGSPLVASSVSGMTNTTKVYVNTTDGNWYYYNGTTWVVGGVYQSTGFADDSVHLKNLNSDVLGNLFEYNGVGNYSRLNTDFDMITETSPSTMTIKITGQIFVEKYVNALNSNPELRLQIFNSFKPNTGNAYSYTEKATGIHVNDLKEDFVDFEFEYENINRYGINAVQFRFNSNNGNAEAIYYVKNLKIYIDDVEVSNLGYSSTYEGNNGSKIVQIVTPLATQEYVDNKIDELDNKIENLDNKIEDLDNKIKVGNAYHIEGNISHPGVAYRIPETIYADSVQNIRVKFKIKNLNPITQSIVCYLNMARQGYWGKDILLPNVNFNQFVDENKIYNIDASADVTGVTQHTLLNYLKIYFYVAAPHDFDFYMYDVEIYINGELQTNLTNDLPDGTTDISDEVTFKDLVNNIETEIEEINNNLPTPEDLELIKNYDNVSKSTLKKIVCWGDSITQGGSAGDPWATVLQNLIGETNSQVINKGWSGQCSGTVAWRQGANKVTCAESFTIPATATESEQFQFACSSGYPSNLSHGFDYECTINGIVGNLKISVPSATSSYATFTRKVAGNEVTVPSGSEFVYQDANKYNNCLSIIWFGRNDMAFSWPYQITGPISNAQAIVNNLSPMIKRFLVVSCTTTTGTKEGDQGWNWVKSLNDGLKETFPNNYVDIQEYLSTDAIYDANITPTEDDLQAIADKTIPPSLMAPDGVHPNAIAKELIAQYIYNFLDSKGWVA